MGVVSDVAAAPHLGGVLAVPVRALVRLVEQGLGGRERDKTMGRRKERSHKPKSRGLGSTMWERRAPMSCFFTKEHTSRPVRRSMTTTRTPMRAGESGLCMHTSMDDNENKTPKRPAPSID